MDYPHLFMDAAWDSLRGEEGYRVGLFSPHLGTSVEWWVTAVSLGTRSRQLNQHIAKLWGCCRPCLWRAIWGGGGDSVFDNARAIYQGVQGRVSVGLWVQQWVLRRVNLLPFRHPRVVHFVFVPSLLQPVDRVSR